jgi:ribosomal protein S18 acetylase RimI-like enzyme
MLRIEYMDEADFASYLEQSISNYAEEKVKAGTWRDDGALVKSRETYARLLPEGNHTKDQHIFSLTDTEKNRKVGVLWLGIPGEDADSEGAFLFDLLVYPEFRRLGYGMQAMKAVEEVARHLGRNRISLHVFGHNRPAIELYEKSGYLVEDIVMYKEI